MNLKNKEDEETILRLKKEGEKLKKADETIKILKNEM